MFNEFTHRHTPCTVDGMADLVILSRELKGTNVIDKESRYNGVFSPSSDVETGSLVMTENSFLVATLRKTVEQDNYCSLIKSNASIIVQRYSQTYDDNGNPTGDPLFIDVEVDVIAFAQYVTASLRQQEPGLLPTTSYVLNMQTSVDIRKPQDTSLISPDRVILIGHPYQVDVIDDVKYPNLYHVQLSEDSR